MTMAHWDRILLQHRHTPAKTEQRLWISCRDLWTFRSFTQVIPSKVYGIHGVQSKEKKKNPTECQCWHQAFVYLTPEVAVCQKASTERQRAACLKLFQTLILYARHARSSVQDTAVDILDKNIVLKFRVRLDSHIFQTPREQYGDMLCFSSAVSSRLSLWFS